jgi:hypothetical protein
MRVQYGFNAGTRTAGQRFKFLQSAGIDEGAGVVEYHGGMGLLLDPAGGWLPWRCRRRLAGALERDVLTETF